jgi:iron-sulfur cluster repair protein YtfE (RIC family)
LTRIKEADVSGGKNVAIFIGSHTMPSLAQLLGGHHKHCDSLFASAEEAALERRWDEADRSYACFRGELEAHFAAEESHLFPAFEAATGLVSGPTQVMRMEHGQMRDLLVQMSAALGARDATAYGGLAETLLILMQQHNLKEENILYPMCDQAVSDQRDELAARLQQELQPTCPQ